MKPEDLITTETTRRAGKEQAAAPGPSETAGNVLPGEALAAYRDARMKGYEGDPCPACGNLTLIRNGSCLKCATCGSTTGCS